MVVRSGESALDKRHTGLPGLTGRCCKWLLCHGLGVVTNTRSAGTGLAAKCPRLTNPCSGVNVMKKKKPFVKPELREEASLAEVTLQSGGATVI